MFRHRPRSFDALQREHGDRIFRFCYRLCGHREDAEDLAQEVLLLAWQNLSRFEGRSSMSTWLYRIAVNRWSRVRQTRPPSAVSLEEHHGSPTPNPAGMRIDSISLEDALAALPDDYRIAFLLVKAEGLKYREAAEALGIPQGTVQSRVHEATTRLRQRLLREAEDVRPLPCLRKGCSATEGGER